MEGLVIEITFFKIFEHPSLEGAQRNRSGRHGFILDFQVIFINAFAIDHPSLEG
jgi:hypothetical protein